MTAVEFFSLISFLDYFSQSLSLHRHQEHFLFVTACISKQRWVQLSCGNQNSNSNVLARKQTQHKLWKWMLFIPFGPEKNGRFIHKLIFAHTGKILSRKFCTSNWIKFVKHIFYTNTDTQIHHNFICFVYVYVYGYGYSMHSATARDNKVFCWKLEKHNEIIILKWSIEVCFWMDGWMDRN